MPMAATRRRRRNQRPPRRPRRQRQQKRPRRAAARSSVIPAEAVREAAVALRGIAVRTPLQRVDALGAWLKLENLQPVGAFKLRGAYNAIRRLPEAGRRQGVITYSSGNHGQAVAYAARQFRVRAVIVMPETAPAVKVGGGKERGGGGGVGGRTSADRHPKAQGLPAAQGIAGVPP